MDTKEIIPRGNIAVLIFATTISGLSNIALSFLPLYFTSLGGTILQYGIITTFATLIGIPATIGGGVLTVRHSVKTIAILTSWVGPAILLGYYFSNSWTVLTIPILVGAGGALGSTAWRQLVADATVQKSRTAQLSIYQTLTAVPAMFAPLLGGYLVHTLGILDGFRDGALIGLALSPVSTILLIKFLRERRDEVQPEASTPVNKVPISTVAAFSHWRNFWSNLVQLPKALIPLLSAYILVIVANSTTSPYLIFYATSIAKLDSFQWGIILTLQMVFANLVRTPLGLVSDRLDKRKVLFASVLATAPLSLFLVLERSFFGILCILIAMVATGVSYGPTHEALQIELTPREKRPALFAVYDVLRTAATSVGTLLGAVLFTTSFELPFYGFTAIEVCAGAIIACAFFRKSGRYRTLAPPSQ